MSLTLFRNTFKDPIKSYLIVVCVCVFNERGGEQEKEKRRRGRERMGGEKEGQLKIYNKKSWWEN